MAWIRTATSMIGFGFTIYKFFQFEAPHEGHRSTGLTPRDFALMMISLGLGTLLLAMISRRLESRYVSLHLGRWRGSLSEAVAGLVFVLGTVLLLATVFHD